MVVKHLPCVRHDNEDGIETESPETNYDAQAHHTAWTCKCFPKTRPTAGWRVGRIAASHCVLSWLCAACWCGDYVDMADIVLWAREAAGVAHCLAARHIRLII